MLAGSSFHNFTALYTYSMFSCWEFWDPPPSKVRQLQIKLTFFIVTSMFRQVAAFQPHLLQRHSKLSTPVFSSGYQQGLSTQAVLSSVLHPDFTSVWKRSPPPHVTRTLCLSRSLYMHARHSTCSPDCLYNDTDCLYNDPRQSAWPSVKR